MEPDQYYKYVLLMVWFVWYQTYSRVYESSESDTKQKLWGFLNRKYIIIHPEAFEDKNVEYKSEKDKTLSIKRYLEQN